jgi:hypothetical protein
VSDGASLLVSIVTPAESAFCLALLISVGVSFEWAWISQPSDEDAMFSL